MALIINLFRYSVEKYENVQAPGAMGGKIYEMHKFWQVSACGRSGWTFATVLIKYVMSALEEPNITEVRS